MSSSSPSTSVPLATRQMSTLKEKRQPAKAGRSSSSLATQQQRGRLATASSSSLSGVYHGESDDGQLIILRVDVDTIQHASLGAGVASAPLFMMSADVLSTPSSPPTSWIVPFARRDSAVQPAPALPPYAPANGIVMGQCYALEDGDQALLSGDAALIDAAYAPLGLLTLSFAPAAASGRATAIFTSAGNGTSTEWHCRFKSPFFRRILLEVDHDAHLPLELPWATSTSGRHHTTLGVQDVLAAAGIDLVIDTEHCNSLEDPDPTSDWTDAELHQSMLEHFHSRIKTGAVTVQRQVGHNTTTARTEGHTTTSTTTSAADVLFNDSQWHVWALLASRHRNARIAGTMFDNKRRLGFAIFLDHPLLRAAHRVTRDGNTPYTTLETDMARRHLLHTFVHELGHTLNLQHSWSPHKTHNAMAQPASTQLTFMNYPWRYDQQRHTPGAFFTDFQWQFAPAELRFLRHGRRAWLQPGAPASTWAADATTSSLPPILPPPSPSLSHRAQLRLRAPVSPCAQGEPILLSLRVRNTHTRHALDLPSVPSLNDDSLVILITHIPNINSTTTTTTTNNNNNDDEDRTSNSTTTTNTVRFESMIESSVAQQPLRLKAATPSAIQSGANRHSVLLPLSYGAHGFYFAAPGTYRITVALHTPQGTLVTPEPAIVTVASADPHPLFPTVSSSSSLSSVPSYDTQTGEFIALAGSPAPSFEPARALLYSIATTSDLTTRTHAVYFALILANALSSPLRHSTHHSRRTSTSATSDLHTSAHAPALLDAESLMRALSLVNDALSLISHDHWAPVRALLYAQLSLQRLKILHLIALANDSETSTTSATHVEEPLAQSQQSAQLIRLASSAGHVSDHPVDGPLAQLGLVHGVPDASLVTLRKQFLTMLQSGELMDESASAESLHKVVDEIFQTFFDEEEDDDESSKVEDSESGAFSEFDDVQLDRALALERAIANAAVTGGSARAGLEYALSLLVTGRVRNAALVQHAVNKFIMSSTEARASGLALPEPRPLTEEERALGRGALLSRSPPNPQAPLEQDVDYYRCDAGLNWHHMHWHIVYGSRAEEDAPHLERKGEFFLYMHQQMLARYDCERLACGLGPVVPWDYHETDTDGLHLGDLFYQHRLNRRMRPRPKGFAFSPTHIIQLRQWRDALHHSIDTGIIGRVPYDSAPITANLLGNVLEPSVSRWRALYGNLHNHGHNLFGGAMLSTRTALRDPIFWRWHKHIDTFGARLVNHTLPPLDLDSIPGLRPPVTVRPRDLIVLSTSNIAPPEGFDAWNNDTDDWARNDFASDVLHTTLGEPQRELEIAHLDHDPFVWHVRVARVPGASDLALPLSLTARLFLALLHQTNDRLAWIEMDKCRVDIPAGASHTVFSRRDRHSSVIRRRPQDQLDQQEHSVTVSPGFCECGLPPNLLLPRGTRPGSHYRLFIFFTDNAIDTLNARTHCGSLSFCGAKGMRYPDTRPLGFPFSTRLSFSETPVTETEQLVDTLPNVTMTHLIVCNSDTRFGEPPVERGDRVPLPPLGSVNSPPKGDPEESKVCVIL